ncbi:Coproporphyrinogen-III oxidase [Vanrija albida]|uniref:coproporphyrinogen oxidase n=1 Tax=Vanrija albida TaxID=181172 RepID=A0ABR3Q0M4_9TREE
MSFRQPLRCCRGAAQTLRAQAARRAPAARAYSSQHSNPASFGKLAGLAASSAAAAFTLTMAYNYYKRPDGVAKLDMVPNVVALEAGGETWEPVHAREQDDPQNPMRIRMATWVTNMQDHIVKGLEALEASAPPDGEHAPATFFRDHWIRPSGGEGSSCVLSGGRVFEKAGVNVSIVEGKLSKGAQAQMRNDHSSIPISDEPLPYFATGVSIVIHPRNPHAPTTHLNYRYFELADPKNPDGEPLAWWFGGGADLTPNYFYEEDAVHFHQTLKDACDKHSADYYPAYKKWCDKYFYLPHRGETRGIGGIFFDDLTTSSEIHGDKKPSRDEIFEFVKSASSAFLPAYIPIVQRRHGQKYDDLQRRWQLVRRGRYVEFNLLYDRGTKFGLNIPGARVESILMSLPEVARWEYMTPLGTKGSGTPEEKLIDVLKTTHDWIK